MILYIRQNISGVLLGTEFSLFEILWKNESGRDTKIGVSDIVFN